MKKFIFALALAATFSAQAAPQIQETPVSLIQPNDGFIEALRAANHGPEMRVCPKAVWAVEQGQCIVERRALRPDITGPSITPQEFLDETYGKGVTIYDGIAPGQSSRVFIYYRIVK